MRQAGTLETEAAAHRLADYLLTLNIANRVEPAGDRWAVWILDENQLDRSKQELQGFLANPQDPRYDRSREAEAVRRQEAARAAQARKNIVEVRDRWRPTATNAKLTAALIAASLVVAVFTHLGQNLSGLGRYLYISWYRFPGPWQPWQLPDFGLIQIAEGQVWRLITPIFLHFGIAHLVFDMWALYQLGGAVEYRHGTLRLAFIVVTSAVISNLAQYFYNGPGFGGMSGVVYAVFGYIWMQSKFVPGSGLFIPRDMVFMLVLWFFLCMFDAIGPAIANAAHAGGLAVGIAIGLAPLLWRRR